DGTLAFTGASEDIKFKSGGGKGVAGSGTFTVGPGAAVNGTARTFVHSEAGGSSWAFGAGITTVTVSGVKLQDSTAASARSATNSFDPTGADVSWSFGIKN